MKILSIIIPISNGYNSLLNQKSRSRIEVVSAKKSAFFDYPWGKL